MAARTNPLVTVVIPARNERYLVETIDDLYAKRAGQIETIIILDGWTPPFEIPEHPGLKVVKNATVHGMRPSINHAAEIAKGKYLMKIDAHCSIGEGWDRILAADCDDNWVVVPRRFWLDPVRWDYVVDKNGNVGYVDFEAYLWPFIQTYKPRLTCRPYPERADELEHEQISEDMGFQGSLWFMTLEHYRKRLNGLDSHGYGTFAEEPQEIGLKTQLGPWQGAVMRNKNTWYAHWAKPSEHWKTDPEIAGRVTDEEREAGYRYSFDYWWFNRWSERVHDFQWLVDKFWPLRRWPENWREQVRGFTRYLTPDLARRGIGIRG